MITVQCEPPHMRVGNECCLDINNNQICDLDEEVVEASTSTTNPEPLPQPVWIPPHSTTATTSSTTTTSIACTMHTDCGEDWEYLRCYRGSVYSYVESPRCLHPGQLNAECTWKSDMTVYEKCEQWETCVNAECVNASLVKCGEACGDKGILGWYCSEDCGGDYNADLGDTDCGSGKCCCNATTATTLPGATTTIPSGGAREYYCEWSWPQKIIDKNTGEVLWPCTGTRPYCKAGTTECCRYDSRLRRHFDCVDMNAAASTTTTSTVPSDCDARARGWGYTGGNTYTGDGFKCLQDCISWCSANGYWNCMTATTREGCCVWTCASATTTTQGGGGLDSGIPGIRPVDDFDDMIPRRTTTTLAYCVDSDGRNYYVKGYVQAPGKGTSYDYCAGQGVYEHYCVDRLRGGKLFYTCPHGCDGGACNPTTTTVRQTTTTHPDYCTDTDGGVNYYRRGSCTGYNSDFTQYYTTEEDCINQNQLYECWCEPDGRKNGVIHSCPQGCQDGRCVGTTTTTHSTTTTTYTTTTSTHPANCVDTDGGQDYYVRGSTTGLNNQNQWTTFTDYCGGNQLQEFWCNYDNKAILTQHNCPTGCANGKCNPTTTTTTTVPDCGDECRGLGYTYSGCGRESNGHCWENLMEGYDVRRIELESGNQDCSNALNTPSYCCCDVGSADAVGCSDACRLGGYEYIGCSLTPGGCGNTQPPGFNLPVGDSWCTDGMGQTAYCCCRT